MDSKGNIRDLTEEQAKAIRETNKAKLAEGRPADPVELTELLARFMKSRSKLFRETWARKLGRGLTSEQKTHLESMVSRWARETNYAAVEQVKKKPFEEFMIGADVKPGVSS